MTTQTFSDAYDSEINICKSTEYKKGRCVNQIFFYDNFRLKIEIKKERYNRFSNILNRINFEWTNINLNSIKPKLNKVVFLIKLINMI